MDSWGTMTRRAIGRVIAGFLLLATPVMAAESPAELISSYRLKHGEVRVVRDATLDRIALEQARAMAARDNLSHDVLGSFTRRIAPARAGRAAENIAYGYESFEKTLGLWIDSSGHRKNLLLHNASRVGIASAKIMERTLTDAVRQQSLTQWSHRTVIRNKSEHLLSGLLFDDAGHHMV